MNMTKEEAIKSLKNIVEYWTYKPTEVEAAKMAIDALLPVNREQVEKVWRGEWIAVREAVGGYKCSRCKAEAVLDCNDEFVLDNFCPRCGAAMTDEAVDMVMERLGALKDGKDD